jgi:hypothetical protein
METLNHFGIGIDDKLQADTLRLFKKSFPSPKDSKYTIG